MSKPVIDLRATPEAEGQLVLLSPVWHKKMLRELCTFLELQGKTLSADVSLKPGGRANHPEFEARLSWMLVPKAPVDLDFTYSLAWDSHDQQFGVYHRDIDYCWKVPLDQAGLAEELIALGILGEMTELPAKVECYFDLHSIQDDGTGPSLTVIPFEKKEDWVWRVAVSCAQDIPKALELGHWLWSIEPVLLRDPGLMAALAARLYGGRTLNTHAQLYDARLPGGLTEVTPADFEALTESLTSQDGSEAVFLDFSEGLQLWCSREYLAVDMASLARVEPTFPPREHDSATGRWWFCVGATPPEAYDLIEQRLKDEAIWDERQSHVVFDGEEWTLEHHTPDGVRKLQISQPDRCPFLDFIFEMLRLLGFELDVRLHSSFANQRTLEIASEFYYFLTPLDASGRVTARTDRPCPPMAPSG